MKKRKGNPASCQRREGVGMGEQVRVGVEVGGVGEGINLQGSKISEIERTKEIN